ASTRATLLLKTSNLFFTRSTASPHWPASFWRNSFIVGYHGESSRSSIHRQSARLGSSSHTGVPIAPARCATAVSTLITRSRFAIKAAVSTKSANWSDQSFTIIPEGGHWACLAGSPFWMLWKRTQGTWPSGASVESGIDLRQSFLFSGLPAQATPTLRPAGSFDSMSRHLSI